MIFFSLVEMKQDDFKRKLRDFLVNSNATKFCINLNKDQLLDFEKQLLELKKEVLCPKVSISSISEANISGITSFLCIFEKCTA